MSQLNSLLESSANNFKSIQSDAARLAGKWEKTGLLEGMGSEISFTIGKKSIRANCC